MKTLLEPKYKYYLKIENLEDSKQGQIFWAGSNFNKGGRTSHCFAVISSVEKQGYVYGAMLSSSDKYGYIPLANSCLKENYSSIEKFEYPNRKTFFAPKKFVKFEEWAPFYLVGELTEEGLEIIKNEIGDLNPQICRWNKNVEIETKLIKDTSIN